MDTAVYSRSAGAALGNASKSPLQLALENEYLAKRKNSLSVPYSYSNIVQPQSQPGIWGANWRDSGASGDLVPSPLSMKLSNASGPTANGNATNNGAIAGAAMIRPLPVGDLSELKGGVVAVKYYSSCDVAMNVKIKIHGIDGLKPNEPLLSLLQDPHLPIASIYGSAHTDMYVECELFSNGTRLCLPIRTSYKTLNNKYRWKEWITFPVMYKDLPLDTQVRFTVWDVYGPRKGAVVGGTTFQLFGKGGKLKTGRRKLKLWNNKAADDTTWGRIEHKDELARIEKLFQQEYVLGKIPKVDWLDKLTFRELNNLNKIKAQEASSSTVEEMVLNVQFPTFDLPVRFMEKDADASDEAVNTNRGTNKANSNNNNNNAALSTTKTTQNTTTTTAGHVSIINDPEVMKRNPVEAKHLKLALSLSTGLVDRDLKPTNQERIILNNIINYSPLQEISMEDKKILWKFRYYLQKEKKALTKFLKCVDWEDVKESREATKLLENWAEIDTADALGLLSSFYKAESVRHHAIKILEKADNEEIKSILLQLVQALRYEKDGADSYLAQFLIKRACSDLEIATNLYWYLNVEESDATYGSMYRELQNKFCQQLKRKSQAQAQTSTHGFDFYDILSRQKRLVKALCDAYAKIKTYSSRPQKIQALKKILHEKGDPWRWPDIFLPSTPSAIESSETTTTGAGVSSSSSSGGTSSPTNSSSSSSSSNNAVVDPTTYSSYKSIFAFSNALRLPLNPNIAAIGLFPDEVNVFKSAKQPIALTFKVEGGDKYKAIFKSGDDLRQDQLVIQLIRLMDGLLKKNGLDLKLTPYRVLATSTDNGFVELVPSMALAEVIQTYNGDIRKFFAKYHPDPSEMAEVMDNYVKSCAGYCVITYILGIGDRHLDNLLMTTSGHLFHIDFGFILGRDPKPFPPPMKLCKEMVDGMGGSDSEYYKEFKTFCCESYNILRKNANLILNLLILMADANIPDIMGDPSKKDSNTGTPTYDPMKNILKVHEKLKLDITDEQAIQYMQSIINESVKALFPQITETFHRWAQYWRS